MKEEKHALQFAVLGLGHFGMSVVKTLAEQDVNILACDRDAAALHDAADYATQVVQTDVTDTEAIEKLGIGNFDVVVIDMREDFEASLLTAMAVKEQGAKQIVVKAVGRRQKKILESIGVNRVVQPDVETGIKLAKGLVQPNIMDVLEQTGYTIVEMRPMPEWVGKTVGQSNIRKTYGYTILVIARGKEKIMPVSADSIIKEGDILVALSER